MEALSLRLFGTLRVTCDGSVVDIPARKARALLAYLAVAERAQNREHLGALFWPENSDRRARANLRRGLWTLNQTPAASWLEATTDTIELCREDLEVDVARFTALLERDGEGTLAEAINLYRGPFLQDLYLADSNEFEAWAAARRDHYRRQALYAMHRLAEMHLEEGAFEQAVSLARRQIAIDDLREDAYRQLFWALARSGKRAVALAEYESLRSHLAQELGVEPSKATQAVIDEIRAGVDSVPELKVTSADPGDAIRSRQTSPRPAVSPYRGLHAYREEDAPYFFGREDFTDQLLAATRRQALVAVIGPSGSGKTSVVHAGLLATLRREEEWLFASFRPGSRPFHALSRALADHLEPELHETERLVEAGRLANALQDGSLTLQDVVERILQMHEVGAGANPRLVLVVDQFEELHTLLPDADRRHSFLDTLLALVFEQQFRRHPICTVILTLRADFVGMTLSYRPMADALRDADVKLGPMTPPEMRRAIVNPAREKGVEFTVGLVERIMDDVGRDPGNLPLLAFALDSLWEVQENGRLTHEGYEAIGKVQGALARHAGAALAELEPAEQALARRIFVQLVRPGKATEDTRRLATRSELGDSAWPLVQHLADRRLLVTGRDPSDQETVEVIHEALIHGWGQLQQWLEEDRAFRLWQEQLRVSRRGWLEHDKDEGALLRGVALATAEQWLARRPDDLSPAERAYIEAGVALRRRREARRERARAERDRLRRTRTWILSAGLLLALVLAGLAGVQWWRAEQQTQALLQTQETVKEERDQARQALASQLAALALSQVDEDLSLALLLGVEATRRFDDEDARDSLHTALAHNPRLLTHLSGPGDELRAVAISPDGRLLAAGGSASQIHLWRVVPFPLAVEPLPTLSLERDLAVRALAFSPGGDLLVAVQRDAVSLFDLSRPDDASQHILTSVNHDTFPGGVEDAAFSPDGRRLALAADDGLVQIWDAIARRPQINLEMETDDDVASLSFTPDGGGLVAGSSGGHVAVWDLGSGQRRQAKAAIGVRDVSVSPDGERLALAGQHPHLAIWTLGPLEQATEADDVDVSFLFDAEYHPDGRLVSAGNDGHLSLWRTQELQMVGEDLPGHRDTVRAVAVEPGGRWLAAAGRDGQLTLWTADPEPATGFRLGRHAGVINSLAFAGRRHIRSGATCEFLPLLSCNWFETGIWNAAGTSGDDLLRRITSRRGNVSTLALSPDGGTAVIGNSDRSITLWNVLNGEQTGLLEGQEVSVRALAYDGTGRMMAAGGCLRDEEITLCREGQVHLWDMQRPQEGQRVLGGFVGYAWPLALSPSGRWLATQPNWEDKIILWDLDQDEPRRRVMDTGPQRVSALALHPQDELLAAGNIEGELMLRRLPALEEVNVPVAMEGVITALAFSPDGRTLAIGGCASLTTIYPQTACLEPQLVVLDLATGQLLARPFLGHSGTVTGLAFSKDGSLLASGDDAGEIILWDFSATPEELACRRANRNLTEEEWQRYFGEEPYRPTCLDLPAP